MYKYREVKCPYCEKKYMWEETSSSSYYLNTSLEIVAARSKCPKCGEFLAVFNEMLEAIPAIDMDKDYKVVREFGI